MSTETIDQLLQQARALSHRRDFDGASDLYRQLLELDPDSVPGHEGLAMVSFVADEYDVAVTEFQRLIQLEPTEVRHYINLGAVFNRLQDHAKAVEILRKAIQRDQRNADAYYNLGIAHRKLNQLTMAISAYKEALRLNPQFAEAYQNLGNVYAEMNNQMLAISNFKKALEVRPDFEKARVALERAEDAMKQAKATNNPFGRLVAAADASSVRLAVCDQREMSAAERLVDRQTVRRLGDELSSLTHDCLEFLKTRYEPAILDLERSVAQGDLGGLGFSRSARAFADAVEGWLHVRGQMKRKMLELLAHEEAVKAPGGLLE
ncbi:MAG: hypothetical protein B7Z55_03595 [Planctomycetales bacterium 12-60-4]|nr:MAG: hypothetical protein B7Z55_03595 [Planctomycetales bacterium 12-60-4]